MDTKLTVIIPFLNEKEEVRNTVKSLRENSDYDFEIILINDCSTDGYDYKKVAQDFGTMYIEHSERKGVAASRDEGVNRCDTEFFLFLDAHMRVYQRDWVEIFVRELDKDRKCLFCASTLNLDKNGVQNSDNIGYGSRFDFQDLNAPWMTDMNDKSNDRIIDIPCVMGASYACNKTYWLYLDGLNGLKSYGLDEQLISIKVWLDGGRCRLLKDIKFGHIFRAAIPMPYEIRPKDYFKNILFVTELFFEFEMKLKILNKYRAESGAQFVSEIINELVENEEQFILERKHHYKTIFPYTIERVIDINNRFVRQD